VHILVVGLHVEEWECRADDGPDGWVPLRIVSLPRGVSGEARRRPVVIFLHATGEWQGTDGVNADARWQAAECGNQSLKPCIYTTWGVTGMLSHGAALVREPKRDHLLVRAMPRSPCAGARAHRELDLALSVLQPGRAQ